MALLKFSEGFRRQVFSIEEGPFADIEKICQKSLTKPKYSAQKIGQGGTRTHVLLLGRPQRTLVNPMPMASRSSVAVSVSQVTLLTYKNFVGLEKRKVNAIV